MSSTFISGEIDLGGVSPERRFEIKKLLENFYGQQDAETIFRENYLSFEEEWDSHEATDNFMQLLSKIVPLLDPGVPSRLYCEGETHSDYWGIIIRKGKLYIQKYRLKPIGDKKEFFYHPQAK
jgi:hypothetical protein